MSCIDGKGIRTFCGKEECLYHYEKSFASFQGICCGASDSKECEENGCNCGKKKVDCWDKEKNGDITPFMVSNGCNKKFYFICNICYHLWSPSLNKVTSKNEPRWCPPCGKKKQILSQTKLLPKFIEQANIKHNNKYTYERTIYVNSSIKVIIICSKHGDWEQTPGNHLYGFGCEQCGIDKRADLQRLTLEEFIIKSIRTHGDLYEYDLVVYESYNTKVKIRCKTHSVFEQTPGNHIWGFGCLDCAGKRPVSKEKFIEMVKLVHKDRYDYSNMNYVHYQEKIQIICSIHGEFIQVPSVHILQEQGCPLCGIIERGIKKRLSKDEFVSKSIISNGNLYDYSEVDYINNSTPVNIKCSLHGIFSRTPQSHMSGYGCYACNNQSSKPAKEWLSMIQSSLSTPLQTTESSDGEYHISTTKFHADGYNPLTKTIYEFHGSFWHGDPSIYSSEMANSVTGTTMGKLYQKTQEKKQKCIELGYKYIEIWESQWKHFTKFIRMIQIQFRKRKSNPI